MKSKWPPTKKIEREGKAHNSLLTLTSVRMGLKDNGRLFKIFFIFPFLPLCFPSWMMKNKTERDKKKKNHWKNLPFEYLEEKKVFVGGGGKQDENVGV